MFGIWVYIFFWMTYTGFGDILSWKTGHVMHLVLHTLTLGNVLFGRAFLLILFSAYGRAYTAVDGFDLCSNSHCFFLFSFLFLSLFCISISSSLSCSFFLVCTITS
ncbi:hypothetical protein V8C42DRAFT_215993 [Trichoderma barbatum]